MFIEVKKYALVVAMILNSVSSAYALTCETDPSKFKYTSTTPTTFNMGTKSEVDTAYKLLSKSIGSIDKYDKAVIFFSKGFSSLTQHYCKNEKCTGADIVEGLSICGARGVISSDVCYPLAVAYRGELYCLLYPGQENFDPSKPFVPYVPFK